MEINSSKPYPPLIDSSLTIKDATVKLFEDDVYIEDLNLPGILSIPK